MEDGDGKPEKRRRPGQQGLSRHSAEMTVLGTYDGMASRRSNALKGVDHQRESGRVGQQVDGDLRLQAAFLGEPGLTEPVPGIGLEVQRRHVVQDSAGRAQSRVRRACGRHLLSPPCLCEPGRRRLTVAYDGGLTPTSCRTRRLPGLLAGSMILAGPDAGASRPPSAACANPSVS